MVLAFYGDLRRESDIATQLGTKPYGTPISAVSRITQDRRYVATTVSLTDMLLKSHLDRGNPIIARVWTAMLSGWTVTTSHVLVVIGYDDEGVFVNDPAFAQHPRFVAWDAFLASWAEFDETSVILTPRL